MSKKQNAGYNLTEPRMLQIDKYFSGGGGEFFCTRFEGRVLRNGPFKKGRVMVFLVGLSGRSKLKARMLNSEWQRPIIHASNIS